MFARSPPFEGTIGAAVRASEFRLLVKAAGENPFYHEVEAFPEAGMRFLVHDFGAGTTFARGAAGKANSLVVRTEIQPDWRAASAITPIGQRVQEHVEKGRFRRLSPRVVRPGEGRLTE